MVQEVREGKRGIGWCGLWDSLEAWPDTLVEAAARGRAGLIKDKVSLRSHFGLQTEGNICVNHGQPTVERNAKRNRKKGEEGTKRQYEYALFKKKSYWRAVWEMKARPSLLSATKWICVNVA